MEIFSQISWTSTARQSNENRKTKFSTLYDFRIDKFPATITPLTIATSFSNKKNHKFLNGKTVRPQ